MKLILVFISLSLLNVSGSISQNVTFNLSADGMTVKELIRDIEKQSHYRFLYNDDFAGLNRLVSLYEKERNLGDQLGEILTGANLTYSELENDLIVLTPLMKNLQQVTVTGRVTDAATGESLPGVSVVIENTNIGTVTDLDGKYSLSVNDPEAMVVFSYVGYTTVRIPIEGRSSIDVSLESVAIDLDEIVVVGYGTQRKATLTGSVSTVDAEFLESRPLTNASQALQGSLGLYVNQAGGGQPGGDVASIRIRGIGTLNDNDPLILVDGIPYNLRDVNPNDIESISVLKDAASAAIYGNRAANGVILINTKRGQRHERMNVELHSYYGWQTATYLPDVVTNSADYMTARDQAAINEGQPLIYGPEVIEEYRNGNDPDLYPNTDWYDIMFSTAPMQEHNLRLSGGTDMTTYSFSVGYLNQEGIMMGSDAQRYSLSSNVTYSYSDRLEFGAIINASVWDRNEPSREAGDMTSSGPIGRALPIHPNILSDGRYGDTHLVTPGHNVFRHPTAIARESWMNDKTERAMINLFADYVFPFDIKYKANFALTNYNRYNHRFIPEIYIYDPRKPDIPRLLRFDPPNRSVRRQNNNGLNSNFYQTLNWSRNFAEQHNINLLLGFSMESFNNSNFDGYIEGFLGNELTELNAGTINKDVGGSSTESKLMSYFGRTNYNFDDRYLLEFSFRYDGSSRFAEGNRWGFFPSFSAAWNVHRETFMENITGIYNLKLRGSWGQLGNQSIALYSYSSNLNLAQDIVRNNSVFAGSAITTLADPNITWETTTMTNFGLDVGLLENRLMFEVDVFEKVTTDILARVNIPSQVGNLGGPITNLYGMSNRGLELTSAYRGSIGDFTYRIGGSIGFVSNKVDYLAGDVQYTTNRYGPIRVIKEGHPVDSWYVYKAEGIFKTQEEVDNHAFQHPATSPGDIKYYDENGDGVIDINDMDVRGRSTPKATYGFNMDFSFKGFELNAFFQGVYGIDIYPWHNIAFPVYNGAGIWKDHFYNSWTQENPDANYPRLFLANRGTGINAMNSTFWLQDASYLRLKNLQLAYRIRSEILNRANISMLKLYINAQNLLTFSSYKLADPEKDIQNERMQEYPSTKIITTGINVSF